MKATTMLMQDDRNANPPTAVAAAAAGRAARAGPPTPIIRGPANETDAADNNLRPRFDDGGFPATLLAMAGHDLRQPLQLIMSAHDALAGLLHDSRQLLILERATAATAELGAQLTQLVEALQLRVHTSDPGHDLVVLRSLLGRLAAEFAEPAAAKGIDLRIPRPAGAVFSHPVLLRGILRNLLRNAIDYTPAGGSVRVLCRRAGAELRIEVRDNGPGIPDDMKSRVFEAFARNDRTRPDGLGLGLFIVKCAAAQLHHRVEIASTLGHGCCFAVVAKAVEATAFQTVR